MLMHQVCTFIPRTQCLENLDPKSSWFISNIFLKKINYLTLQAGETRQHFLAQADNTKQFKMNLGESEGG